MVAEKYKSSHELCAHMCLLNFYAIPTRYQNTHDRTIHAHTPIQLKYRLLNWGNWKPWHMSGVIFLCKFLRFSPFLFRKMKVIFHIVYTSIDRTFVNQSNLFLFVNCTANESFKATCNSNNSNHFAFYFKHWCFKSCSPRSISIYLHFKSSYRNKWSGGIFAEWLWLPLPTELKGKRKIVSQNDSNCVDFFRFASIELLIIFH